MDCNASIETQFYITATLGNKKTFSGMVGNVIFKNLNGKQIAQSRPSDVKQTTACHLLFWV
ncbi:hypothetical protein [Flavobacterium sp.]|uniref:hypothetical protein n=1 Tax=Flavobacterium sp. TaxID=239 RepID=UPI0025F5BDF8|nr:hypothetical protein [Flavobacterium sp.]